MTSNNIIKKQVDGDKWLKMENGFFKSAYLQIEKAQKMLEESEKKNLRLGFLLIFIFLSFLTVISYNHRNMMIVSNKENLQILASEKADQINTLLDEEKDKLLLIAGMSDFKNVLLHPNDSLLIEIAKKRINELENIIPNISILNSNGIVVVGNIDLPGTDYSQHPYFLEKRQDISFTIYSDPLRKKDYYAIIGSVYGDINKTDIIGKIAFDLEVNKLSSLMKQSVQFNSEVYFIDEGGVVIGNKANDISVQSTSEGSVKLCLDDFAKYESDNTVETHAEDILQYINFEGVDVFGAHAYVPNLSGCILAERTSSDILKYSVIDSLKQILNPFIFN